MSTPLVSAVSVSGEISGGRGAALTPAFASDCSASASVTTLRTAIPAASCSDAIRSCPRVDASFVVVKQKHANGMAVSSDAGQTELSE